MFWCVIMTFIPNQLKLPWELTYWEKRNNTALGSPVVPLLKHNTAQTSLFNFPRGNLEGWTWPTSPYRLPASSKSAIDLNPSACPSRTKMRILSTLNLFAALVTTPSADTEVMRNLHPTVFKTCVISSSVYAGEERAGIPPARITPNKPTGYQTEFGAHIETTSPSRIPCSRVNAVERYVE